MRTRKPRVIATTLNGETALVLGGRTFRLIDLEAIRQASDAVALNIPVDYLRPFTDYLEHRRDVLGWPRYWQWLGQLLYEQVHGTN